MSFPAWSKCFPSCGFLIWKSRLGSAEPWFRERRRVGRHGRRAGGRDDSAAHGTADHGTLEHEPTGFVRHCRTNCRSWSVGKPNSQTSPEANATQTRLQWRDAGT